MLHVTSHPYMFLLSSPDVICLPKKKRNCISLKCTCEKRVFIPNRLNMCNLQFSFQKHENRFNFTAEIWFFLLFSTCSYAISRLLRTFTSKSCTIRADFFLLFNKAKRISWEKNFSSCLCKTVKLMACFCHRFGAQKNWITISKTRTWREKKSSAIESACSDILPLFNGSEKISCKFFS